MKYKYDNLREKALANFELLLNYWNIEYKKITEVEYDFLSPSRSDVNFGACRFNLQKGRGADFASSTISASDCTLLGNGFDISDFSGYSNGMQQKSGFDIIGLCQRVHRCNSYSDAAGWLNTDLKKISENGEVITPAKDAAEKRRKEQELSQQKVIEISQKLWHYARPIENTAAERYFNSRGLSPQENTIRYSILQNKETGKKLPTALFKVQASPDGPIVAVHRIFLKEDGLGKADLEEPKMALGRIKGAGIWFGIPNEILYVAEGPENALVYREIGVKFCVSTVYSTNYANLEIPNIVKKVVLVPDEDKAGLTACNQAIEAYKKQGKIVRVVRPNGG